MPTIKMTAQLLIVIAASLCLPHLGSAAEYFIAPTGDDANPGTIAQPFASIARAQQAAQPGDTVYIRGGTYRISEEQIMRRRRIWTYVFDLHKSGRVDAPIRYWAWQDERPVFDFSQVRAEGTRIIAFFVTGSWLHFKGFEVVGVQVTMPGHTQSECFQNLGSHNIYEHLSMHDGQAIGFYLLDGSHNLVLNCDAYRNHDHTSENGLGGNTDGFGCHPRRGAVGNVFRGCRAWFNSDDGFDCIHASEAVTFEQCWAFYNGYTPDFRGLADGNGFKVGGWGRTPTNRLARPMPEHTVRFCLAVRNKANGFYANHHPGGNVWINNTAFRNRTNFNMLERVNHSNGIDFDMDAPGRSQKLYNNLGFRGRREVSNLDLHRSTTAGNYFDLGISVSEVDFQSLDETQLVLPRQADGSLPSITFLHLAAGSNCIDKGIDVGFPFHGAAPDLGCFEFDPGP
ncbi:MAG: pectate lyase [Pirellulaceae bacterium]|nr:MAG: pectate lyase [Pirellulaceae bacterium]